MHVFFCKIEKNIYDLHFSNRQNKHINQFQILRGFQICNHFVLLKALKSYTHLK